MGSYRGHSPNFLGVVRRLFRGGAPKKCQGAKIYSRTKQGDTVNYQLARSRLLGHTSVKAARRAHAAHVVSLRPHLNVRLRDISTRWAMSCSTLVHSIWSKEHDAKQEMGDASEVCPDPCKH